MASCYWCAGPIYPCPLPLSPGLALAVRPGYCSGSGWVHLRTASHLCGDGTWAFPAYLISPEAAPELSLN